MNEENMNDNTIKRKEQDWEMLDEYDLDYSKAKPNRFAERFGDKVVMVVLDQDVAAVFETSEAVNDVLRALIKTMPTSSRVTPKELA